MQSETEFKDGGKNTKRPQKIGFIFQHSDMSAGSNTIIFSVAAEQ